MAANPKATFHFIGHSNGTYLLGRSPRRIPSMRFDRVLLVGSVLPPNYPWADRMRDQQVKLLRNDRASSDVPVGVLCAGLRGLGMRDIGTAGVTGFLWEDPVKTEIYYYRGGLRHLHAGGPVVSAGQPGSRVADAAHHLRRHRSGVRGHYRGRFCG